MEQVPSVGEQKQLSGIPLSSWDASPPSIEEFIEEIMRWEGTPFIHQARVRGVGADCIGVAIGVARVFGYDHSVGFGDHRNYKRSPNTQEMELLLKRYLDPINKRNALPGDLLHLYFIQRPQHIGFLLPDNMILHAKEEHDGSGMVVVHSIDEFWWSRVVSAYRFRGLR